MKRPAKHTRVGQPKDRQYQEAAAHPMKGDGQQLDSGRGLKGRGIDTQLSVDNWRLYKGHS